MRHSTRWMIGFLVLAAAIVGGVHLATSAATTTGPADEGPVRLETIRHSALKRVVLTAAAARRLGVETTAVARSKQRTVIPYDALLYDADGRTWTYANPERLTYVRRRIVIDHIAGNAVYLARGPSAGTRVVTVAGAELYGAELGVGAGE